MSAKSLMVPSTSISISIKDRAKYITHGIPFLQGELHKRKATYIGENAWPPRDQIAMNKNDQQRVDATQHDTLLQRSNDFGHSPYVLRASDRMSGVAGAIDEEDDGAFEVRRKDANTLKMALQARASDNFGNEALQDHVLAMAIKLTSSLYPSSQAHSIAEPRH